LSFLYPLKGLQRRFCCNGTFSVESREEIVDIVVRFSTKNVGVALGDVDLSSDDVFRRNL
jgi:hypothetical protein